MRVLVIEQLNRAVVWLSCGSFSANWCYAELRRCPWRCFSAQVVQRTCPGMALLGQLLHWPVSLRAAVRFCMRRRAASFRPGSCPLARSRAFFASSCLAVSFLGVLAVFDFAGFSSSGCVETPVFLGGSKGVNWKVLSSIRLGGVAGCGAAVLRGSRVSLLRVSLSSGCFDGSRRLLV